MVPHLQWPGCNDKRRIHHLLYASEREYSQVSALLKLPDHVAAHLAEKAFLSLAEQVRSDTCEAFRTYSYQYIHLEHSLLGHPDGMWTLDIFRFPYSVNNAMLAVPDEMYKFVQMFFDKYKPMKKFGEHAV